MQTQNSFGISGPETTLLKENQQKKQLRFKTAVIVGLVLTAFVGLMIIVTPKTDFTPSYSLNQRSSYFAQDQLCVYQVSTQTSNCTLITTNTTAVTVDVNEQNATHILLLDGLQVQSQTNYSNGTMMNQSLYESNVNITGQLNNRLRILQNAQEPCFGQDCGDYNQIPMISFVTDKFTGEVIEIGVPSGVEGLMLQSLVSNVLHLGPNVQETQVNDNEIINPYSVGKYVFLSERTIESNWFGSSKVSKVVNQDDCLNSTFLIGDQFYQQQETTLTRNNQIERSYMLVNITIDHSVNVRGSQNEFEYMTIVTDESELINQVSYYDAKFTQLLQSINSNQDIKKYTQRTIQDKLEKKSKRNSFDINELKQKAARLLTELPMPSSTECPQNGLINFSKTVLSFTVKGTKLDLDLSLKGTAGNGETAITVKFCVAMEGMCLFEIVDSTLNYTGLPMRDMELNGVQNITLLDTGVTVKGFAVHVGVDFSYGFVIQQNVTETSTILGIADTFIVPVLLTIWGETEIPDLAEVRAAVIANIFTGNFTSNIAFGWDSKLQSINSNSYTVNFSLDMEEFRAYVIAQMQYTELSTKQRCKKHLGVVKVCYPIPTVGLMGDWMTLYSNNWGFPALVQNFTLYGFQSDCFLKQQ